MSAYTLAVAGKGGTGKTTICGMLIDWLCRNGRTPVLAVDADANSNLNEVLGVEVEHTLGEIREVIASADTAAVSPIPASMSKKEFMDAKFHTALVEDDDFDLLVMGRTQGKGCYCFVNDLLSSELRKLKDAYRYMIVDNEAGMEHISRGVLPSVNAIVLVSDCSRRGIQAVSRIAELVKEVDLGVDHAYLIVNRAPHGELNEGVKEEIEKSGLDLIGVVPHDEMIYEYDSDGKPTAKLPDDSPARAAVNEIAEKLFA
ncbi:MAG: AAA family ATPase [Oscillospiraceae bacterium]|nr:AAA family ATPase [Oscillospiraceae bacterium]MBR4928743.1 AAA family ATPase [Oscillospiraceae bacterium]MBR5045440.1 AAA family ATPase [Oscillospiraceae bacterium]